MKAKFLFLGTGGSSGVPVIGCKCAVCTSTSLQNQRLRTSGLIQLEGRNLLVDVGPDFRQQALRAKVDHIDALLLTHTHSDHIAGIDELRVFSLRQKKPFPCLLSLESLKDLQMRYPYFFGQTKKIDQTMSLSLELHILEQDSGEVEFLGLKIGYFSYSQGGMKVTGFRLGDFAYVSDIKSYEETLFHSLKGVKTLVVSALFEETSPVHFSLDEAIAFSKKVEASHTYITHISHKMDQITVSKKLPQNVHLATDGLEISFEY